MTPEWLSKVLTSAVAHHRAGRLREAEAGYREILAAVPTQADALQLLGVLRGQAGEPREAAELIGRAIAAAPGAPAAWHSNLGKFLADAGEVEAAVDACRRAVALKPDLVDGHVNLGNALRLEGDAAAAAAEYRYAIRLQPALAVAHRQLGAVLLSMGGGENLAAAGAALREAARLNPADADAANLLGIVLRGGGDHAGAAAAFGAAVRVRPDFAAAQNNLGNALQALGKLDEAAEWYRAALQAEPGFAEAHNNLGGLLKEQGDVDASVGEYRRAVELKPASAAMHSNLLLALNYQVGSTRESLFEAAKEWARRHAAPLAGEIVPRAAARGEDRRLRIGYVTADFREHASAFFLVPLLENHDRSRVEVFCYSDVARPDAITERCRRAAHQWREIAGMTDGRVAEMVRADGIDILVDLKLHADQNRLLVFTRKPAPVQVTWLGYPGTTGLAAMDYRLSDPFLDPLAEEERFYVEKTVRLPDSFWCYDPMSEECLTALPALRGGDKTGGAPRNWVTFGCLNHLSKINDRLIEIWAQVLDRVVGSNLTLLAAKGSHRVRIARAFEKRGIEESRVEFVAPRPRQEYLWLYHHVDIGLDSWPVNGHTTTFDSLWMGVPVVTMAGPTALGRAGVSQLRNLGLGELIAGSAEEYVGIAAGLAGDLERLGSMRQGLRRRMEGSPLMRGRDFARGMEEAFGRMWREI